MTDIQIVNFLIAITLSSLLAISAYKIIQHLGNIIVHYFGNLVFSIFMCALYIDIIFMFWALNVHWIFQVLMIINLASSIKVLRQTYVLTRIMKEVEDIKSKLDNVTDAKQLITMLTRVDTLIAIAEKSIGKKIDRNIPSCYDMKNDKE